MNEKKKMNAGLRAYLDKKAGKKTDKDGDKDDKKDKNNNFIGLEITCTDPSKNLYMKAKFLNRNPHN